MTNGVMTAAEIQEELDLYTEARNSILKVGQSYAIAGMTYSKGDLRTIERRIRELREQLYFVSNVGSFGHHMVPTGGRR